MLRLIPDNTKFDFIGQRRWAFTFTALLLVVTLISCFGKGFNLGIDFKGGILIEASYKPAGVETAVDVGELRSRLAVLNLGEVSLQNFGGPATILIRVQQQEGGDEANANATKAIRASLGEGWEYARAESVGPTVGRELMITGALAIALTLLGVAVYVALRFEWQFGVSALICTFHDVIVSLGLISLLGLEFNLTTMAALMTLAGYSINDTVVVFDRIRENMRRYKKATLAEVINMSVNATLSRTIMTAGTTILAIVPMLFLASDTLLNFTAVITWGVIVGTFSSIYVAAALLLYMPPLRRASADSSEPATKSA